MQLEIIILPEYSTSNFTLLLFSYLLYEDSAVGGDLAEQLSSLIYAMKCSLV